MKNALINTLTNTTSGIASTILRIPVGVILMAHGAQKLFGSFGGYGLEGTGQWMASIGLEPGYFMALMAGSAEFFGGLALIIGLLVRPAAAVIAFTMLMAIFTVHISNGLFMSANGYEYALTLFVVAVSLVFSGAGAYSIDKAITDNTK
ncbi:DoxX family protein [Marinomonas colpomeniae]|jgi:putative oxidoreductase|uniref:DoxX family protein n=1 Tax=Marinomonas colpomeniae TaxID=2774408 RepID=A0ABR8NVF5_9GAMM|nr:DoxX family protein [Marinomonas colpomeniae]MBD5769585.1 DoxX family protein [Marinomonas colpomeniae]